MTQSVHVAVGVILNKNNQILIAKRHLHLHQGGKWEFPGGKVEQNESVHQALFRELKEELGIEVKVTKPLMKLSHNYNDKQVKLDIHWVLNFNGHAEGKEAQEIKWIEKQDLAKYNFPDANKKIIQKILEIN